MIGTWFGSFLVGFAILTLIPADLVAASIEVFPPEIQLTDGIVGTIARGEFHLKNLTNKAVEAPAIRPSCGCTTPQVGFSAIQPGDQATVYFEIERRGPGPLLETITVVDPVTQEHVLISIVGQVKAGASLDTTLTHLTVHGDDTPSSVPLAQVYARKVSDLKVGIVDALVTASGVKAQVTEKPDDRVLVSLYAVEDLPLGVTTERLTLVSDGIPLVESSFTLEVTSPVKVEPSSIDFNFHRMSDYPELAVTLDLPPDSVRVLETVVESGIELSVKPGIDATRAVFLVAARSKGKSGLWQGKIIFGATTQGVDKRITVRVRGGFL